MKIAIFPGSFDPFTNGHKDILERGCKLFDKVIIAVAYNGEKQSFLPIETRKQLIFECTKNIKNVEVQSFAGLTVDFAKKIGAEFILRGLRNTKDFEYEFEMENINRILNNQIETVYISAYQNSLHTSSSAVREILRNNGDISSFVPKNIKEYLLNNIH